MSGDKKEIAAKEAAYRLALVTLDPNPESALRGVLGRAHEFARDIPKAEEKSKSILSFFGQCPLQNKMKEFDEWLAVAKGIIDVHENHNIANKNLAILLYNTEETTKKIQENKTKLNKIMFKGSGVGDVLHSLVDDLKLKNIDKHDLDKDKYGEISLYPEMLKP